MAFGVATAAPLEASEIGSVQLAQPKIPCNCRVPGGTKLPQGTTTCLRWQGEMVTARCDKVLNNTSWTILRKGCDEMS